ncbi:DUF547 domain-containing protein [Aureispira anguillae]|uniref:DUF547 domain-containing protein n=1 Tax=Aureispira anguillae TaxID=2864201 RepID=A0A916DTX9_9BACT|nr:DUF547 domain-containing protein [Aureispira anguillae]BDS12876.1 DUF547 domain-containing protein [Aureispira anguillae]
MRHLCFSSLIVATLILACSNGRTSQETVTENTENTNSTMASMDDPVLEKNTVESVALTEVTSPASINKATEKKEAPKESTPSAEAKAVPASSTPTPEVKPDLPKESMVSSEPTPAPTSTTSEAPKTTVTPTTNPVANANVTTATKPVEKKIELSHDGFDQLLRKYVNSSGGVNYSGFQKEKATLAAYLDLLKKNAPQSSWSKNKEIAYWINLYNAFTIYAIVEKYPVSSIMDLEGGKVWDKKKIVIGGKSLTLNDIEKEKLLKRFKEPRVHFAVNCAAASCPPLLNKAWTEDNVQRYLAKQTKAFINNAKYNSISAKSLEISQIFNWYAGDFGGSDKVVAYFQKYSEIEINGNAKVKFKTYDWKLNKQ